MDTIKKISYMKRVSYCCDVGEFQKGPQLGSQPRGWNLSILYVKIWVICAQFVYAEIWANMQKLLTPSQ